jgi:hypothetical protein
LEISRSSYLKLTRQVLTLAAILMIWDGSRPENPGKSRALSLQPMQFIDSK